MAEPPLPAFERVMFEGTEVPGSSAHTNDGHADGLAGRSHDSRPCCPEQLLAVWRHSTEGLRQQRPAAPRRRQQPLPPELIPARVWRKRSILCSLLVKHNGRLSRQTGPRSAARAAVAARRRKCRADKVLRRHELRLPINSQLIETGNINTGERCAGLPPPLAPWVTQRRSVLIVRA